MRTPPEEVWMGILKFICLEFMGQPIFEKWLTVGDTTHPVEPDEFIFNTELYDWEKKMFLLTDAVHLYLAENHMNMVVADVREIDRVAHAIRDIFWCALHFYHEELRGQSVGIRAGWKVVKPFMREEEGIPSKIQIVGPQGSGGRPPKAVIEALKHFLEKLEGEE